MGGIRSRRVWRVGIPWSRGHEASWILPRHTWSSVRMIGRQSRPGVTARHGDGAPEGVGYPVTPSSASRKRQIASVVAPVAARFRGEGSSKTLKVDGLISRLVTALQDAEATRIQVDPVYRRHTEEE